MNGKQKRTLEAIFADPVSGSIDWKSIERLLIAIGCEAIEGKGSRVKFRKDKVIASFHRPHPEKEAKRYQVRDTREFLIKIGVRP
jgi:predicted RNA binding protein YcfA (HicA-like mRNA interferase family)